MGMQVRRVQRKRHGRRPIPVLKGRIAIYGGAFILAFALGFLCLTYGPHAYNGWRESRLLKRASGQLEKQQLDKAKQTAQQVLAIHPDSLAAFQILADASEKQNRPETLVWRAQIARSLPENLDAQLNLASAALRFGQLDTARRALEGVPADDRDKAAYHVVAGWLARAQGND